jgi:hypothetical protein
MPPGMNPGVEKAIVMVSFHSPSKPCMLLALHAPDLMGAFPTQVANGMGPREA